MRTAVTNLSGAVTDFALSPDGQTFAFIHASQTAPPDLFTIPSTGGLPRRLTDCRSAAGADLRPSVRVPYRSFDGLHCDAYLYLGRLAHEIPQAMLRASTHHRLKEIKTPLLILHGDRDTRVPPQESAQVAATLAAAGLPHEYVVYPGEGHGFRRREHRVDCYTRMLAWIRTYLAE